ncbi:hypothetical protein ACCAA_1050010 [Candidatus Accumulibacter aalborgensis]|uniref:Uncharacterized protein n=1 Tax=Candidatus Accumulibacter aalborgensis TaxID=1860102 RepID=A0A1A8XE81_9PROT|nr:hypothetical protein [Candidatus Accumulibacter aalborgensis]SBT03499.1 hypothetical protein ACCAA_1050010 [Candidatus Accumulibacter aalborgensis]
MKTALRGKKLDSNAISQHTAHRTDREGVQAITIDLSGESLIDAHKAINGKFEQAGIAMAFAQRDLHFDPSSPLRVTSEDARQASPDRGNPRP